MVVYEHAGRYGPEIFMDANQSLMRSKPITVYEKGTSTLATLYTDRTKAVAGSNPFLTDVRGNGSFYAEPGEYDIAFAGHEFTVTVLIDFEDLAEGSPGPTGEQGEPGTPGIPWTFSTTTTDSDPGSGNMRFNNASPQFATFLYIDDLCSTGVNMASWIASFDDNDNETVKGDLSIINVDRTDIWQFLVTGDVIDGGTYSKIPIQFLGGAGTVTNGEELYISYARAGALTDMDPVAAEAMIRSLGFIVSDGSFTDMAIIDPGDPMPDPMTLYIERPEVAP